MEICGNNKEGRAVGAAAGKEEAIEKSEKIDSRNPPQEYDNMIKSMVER